MSKERVVLNLKIAITNKNYSALINDYRVGGMKWNDVGSEKNSLFYKIGLSKEDLLFALGVNQRIAELEEENESYQKLINDLCNKHRVGSLKDLDELYQATTESLYASREYLEELKSAKWELEEQLKNAIVPKFKVNDKIFVIINDKIEEYHIDEVLLKCKGTLVAYRDICEETTITEKNEIFATKEEARAKLEELKGE